MYETFKSIHLGLAAVSFSGFVLRGYWMMMAPALLERRWVGILPHIVDTGFLLSGVALIVVLGLPLATSGWLHVKLAALVVYVVLGSIALKRGRSKRIRVAAFVLALTTFAYIVGVAMSKTAVSWLTFGGL